MLFFFGKGQGWSFIDDLLITFLIFGAAKQKDKFSHDLSGFLQFILNFRIV